MSDQGLLLRSGRASQPEACRHQQAGHHRCGCQAGTHPARGLPSRAGTHPASILPSRVPSGQEDACCVYTDARSQKHLCVRCTQCPPKQLHDPSFPISSLTSAGLINQAGIKRDTTDHRRALGTAAVFPDTHTLLFSGNWAVLGPDLMEGQPQIIPGRHGKEAETLDRQPSKRRPWFSQDPQPGHQPEPCHLSPHHQPQIHQGQGGGLATAKNRSILGAQMGGRERIEMVGSSFTGL